MKIIYLGYLIKKNEIKDHKNVSLAGNNLQLNILKELNLLVSDLQILSIKPLASFPQSKTLIVRREEIFIDELRVKNIGFINIFILKQISLLINVTLELLKTFYLYRRYQCNKVYVFSYNSFPYTSVPLQFSNFFYNLKTVYLAVDIPIHIVIPSSVIKKMLVKIYNYISVKSIRSFDAVISLTEAIPKEFAPDKKTMLLRYGHNPELLGDVISKTRTNDVFSKDFINITYTGALEKFYGINEIIEAFNYLPSQYVMHFFGEGSLEEYLRKEAISNEQIKFHGKVSYEDSLYYQKTSDLLLLLRTDSSINKYSFPSKIIEYIFSGTPILATTIESIPKELDEYINYFDLEDARSIANAIMSVNYIRNIDNRIDFVITNYNWKSEASRILEFLSDV